MKDSKIVQELLFAYEFQNQDYSNPKIIHKAKKIIEEFKDKESKKDSSLSELNKLINQIDTTDPSEMRKIKEGFGFDLKNDLTTGNVPEIRNIKPVPPPTRIIYNPFPFHFFHKWKVIDEQYLYKYLECEKCGKRKVVFFKL